ncbi:MAG: hypothetical protein HYS12_00740 [Planctomycetes bacterium]|nr:hypothetical protein [Planctomycetota bacterium]
MNASTRWQFVVAATAVLCSTGAGVSYHRTKARPLCGLPCYDYQHGSVSPSVTAQSFTAVLVEQRVPFSPGVPPAGTPTDVLQGATPLVLRERVKYFQLPVAQMQVNHCSLSRVALTLHESGSWALSMRADQNPWMTGQDNEVSTPVQLRGAVSALNPPIPPRRLESNGLKRNLFIVKVRCYAAYPLTETLPALAPGKPVLFELPVQEFWVQRGVPYDFWAAQGLPAARQYFDLIDRVEVEFSYR